MYCNLFKLCITLIELIFNRMIKRFIHFILFILVLVPLYAQETDSLLLDEVLSLDLEQLGRIKINVSSVKALDIMSTPSNVTVVDREMIEDYNFQSIAEALAIVPGIDVLQTVIDRNVTTSRGILQNFYANKVLFLINGITTWQPIYGDFHLERIDINDVERIEVLKGPASVLYGTNAYAGVVNVILRDKKMNSIDAYAKFGYPYTLGAGVNTKVIKGDYSLSLSTNAAMEKRKPYSMKADINYPYKGDSTYIYQDQYSTGNIILRGAYKSHSITINAFDYTHSFYGAFPSYTFGGGNMVVNQGALASYQLNEEIATNSQLFITATADYYIRNFPLSADRTTQVHLSATRYNAEAKFHTHVGKHLSFDIGGHAEIRDSHGHETRYAVTDTLISSNLLNDNNIYEGSVFFQPEFILGKLSLMVGGRYTLNSLFGEDLSFRATGLYKINHSHSFKLMAGQSFRVPTMFELYFDHSTVKGNNQLEPERSTSYELAYLLQHKKLFVQASTYLANYTNLIQRVTVDTLIPVYMNAHEFQGVGFEFEVKYVKPKVISAFLSYNFVDGYEGSGKENYQFVPRHTLNLGLNKSIGNIYIYGKGCLISSTEGVYERIDPQGFLDVGVGLDTKRKTIKIKHVLEVKNITNSKYHIPQYIRDQSGVNDIPVLGYGPSVNYSFKLSF